MMPLDAWAPMGEIHNLPGRPGGNLVDPIWLTLLRDWLFSPLETTALIISVIAKAIAPISGNRSPKQRRNHAHSVLDQTSAASPTTS